MNKKLEYKYSLLESSRKTLIESLDKLGISKLKTPPAKDKWSVAQIIYHLNQAEGNSVLYVSKKIKDVNNLKKSGIMESLKIMSLRIAFILPLHYKAPNVLGPMPDGVDYIEIKHKWKETREKMKVLLDSLPEDTLGMNVFKQPAVGRLNVYQMLDFMQVHFNRHKSQIDRIISH